MALDTDALAASLYDHPTSQHNATPQTTAKPSASPSAAGTDDLAELLYDAGDSEAKKLSRRPFNEIFGQPSEQAKDEGAKPGDEPKHEGVRDKPSQAITKTDEQIAEAAEKLTAELKLDTSDPAAGDFTSVAATLGLNKAGASKLIEFDQRRTVAGWEKINGEWRAEVLADPQGQENIAGARAVLRHFGDAKLMADLDRFKWGSNPGLIKALGKIARAYGIR